jgi:MFS transporter, putative metabolite transport protein
VLLPRIGTDALLAGLVFAALLGAWITWQFRIETAGINLEEIGQRNGP